MYRRTTHLSHDPRRPQGRPHGGIIARKKNVVQTGNERGAGDNDRNYI